MTEYEKKIQELRGICEWLQEHGEEVDEQDGAVIIAFENPGQKYTACLAATGNRGKLMALQIGTLECMEKGAREAEPEEGKVIALQ